MWQPYLCDTITGRIIEPIDIPQFSWDLTISDFSLTTDSDKNVAKEDVSGLTVPWTAVPGDTPEARSAAISPLRRAICLFWVTDDDLANSSLGTPVMFGIIKPRTNTRLDTSFAVMGMASFMDYRQCVREGAFGTASGSTSTDVISFTDRSYRGIVAELGQLVCSKPGGGLPIDWQYVGEKGTRVRNYSAYDVQNISMQDIMTKVANVINGPDMTFRPYLNGDRKVGIRFVAGSDANVYLAQDTLHVLSSFDGGGSIESLSQEEAWPVMRWYATGAGQDDSTLCYLAEDRTLLDVSDPWPLVEQSYSDTDTDNVSVLQDHANAKLDLRRLPVMQLTGNIDLSDEGTPAPGEMWPGELVRLAIQDFPTIPDGVYDARLMEMSGDQGTTAKLTFDVMYNPIY